MYIEPDDRRAERFSEFVEARATAHTVHCVGPQGADRISSDVPPLTDAATGYYRYLVRGNGRQIGMDIAADVLRQEDDEAIWSVLVEVFPLSAESAAHIRVVRDGDGAVTLRGPLA
jgi:hypothetical protein